MLRFIFQTSTRFELLSICNTLRRLQWQKSMQNCLISHLSLKIHRRRYGVNASVGHRSEWAYEIHVHMPSKLSQAHLYCEGWGFFLFLNTSLPKASDCVIMSEKPQQTKAFRESNPIAKQHYAGHEQCLHSIFAKYYLLTSCANCAGWQTKTDSWKPKIQTDTYTNQLLLWASAQYEQVLLGLLKEFWPVRVFSHEFNPIHKSFAFIHHCNEFEMKQLRLDQIMEF